MHKRVLVTGGSGFLGGNLVPHLLTKREWSVRVSTRDRSCEHLWDGVEVVRSPDLDHSSDWSEALESVSVVVHTAGRAHVAPESDAADSLKAFREVNVFGTIALARQAAAAGVRQFIFISSIGVNGNTSSQPFTESSEPNPSDPYAVSKLEAEVSLRRICEECGMGLTIIRPPLIYGPRAPGNFSRLLGLVGRQMPLPLGKAVSPKSFIGVDNLCGFICLCVGNPMSVNEIFLVSDDEDISTAEFLRKIGRAYQYRVRLIPVPRCIMRFAAKSIGQEKVFRSLFEPLQIDCRYAKERLDWQPPFSVSQGLEKCSIIASMS